MFVSFHVPNVEMSCVVRNHYKCSLLFIKSKPLSKLLKGSLKEPNMFHNYEIEKIIHIQIDCSQLSKTYYNVLFSSSTRDRFNAAENLQLYRVVCFFCPRSSCTMNLMLFSERPPIYASCMTISGGRTEQHIIIGFGELAAHDLNM